MLRTKGRFMDVVKEGRKFVGGGFRGLEAWMEADDWL